MTVPHDGPPSNPYAAPDAVLDGPFVDENDWAQVLRSQYRREENSVKHLTWLNFLAFILFAPFAVLGVVRIIYALYSGLDFLRSTALTLFILGDVTFCIIVGLNLWIWYSLRRLSPWAWRLERVFAVVALFVAVIVLVGGLWIEAPAGSPFIVAILVALPSLLILRVLSKDRVSRLFDPDYQQAIKQTKQKRL